MPITYETMSPVGAAAEYGETQQKAKNAEFQMKMFQVNQQAAHQAQQAANERSRIQMQGEAQAEEQASRERIAGQQMQSHFAERAMAVNASQQEQEARFTHADNVRLQKLNQGIATVDQMWNNGNGELSRDEYVALRGSINGDRTALESMRDLTSIQRMNEEMRVLGSRAAGIEQVNAQRANNAREEIFDVNGNSLGLFQRGRDGMPVLIAGSGPGGGTRGGASGGGGGAAGGAPASEGGRGGMTYAEAAKELRDRMNSTTGNMSAEERTRIQSSPQATRAAIGEIMAEADTVNAEAEERRARAERRRPGGTLPFDQRAERQEGEPPFSGRELVEVGFNNAVYAARRRHDKALETRLLITADNFRELGGDTGRMDREDQETLRQMRYYRNEFTPEVDRLISNAVRMEQVPVQGGRPGQTRSVPANPEMAQAAQEFRNLLIESHGRRPGSDSRDEQEKFDRLRGQLGITSWPPALQTPSARTDVRQQQAPPRAVGGGLGTGQAAWSDPAGGGPRQFGAW